MGLIATKELSAVGKDTFDDFLDIESPNKYGKDVYSDLSQLADSLAGRNPGGSGSPAPRAQSPRTAEVDESFWDAVRDTAAKYGSTD
jgi:hypothetical protein